MKCPVCGCNKDRVLDTRSVDDDKSIRRRRECTECKYRFTTVESVETTRVMVVKRDNTRELYDRTKIMNGLVKACQKRPVSLRQMEALISTIENELANSMRPEITTVELGEMVMKHLRLLDEVAYIRFVSVYRKFDDIDSFFDELSKLKNREI